MANLQSLLTEALKQLAFEPSGGQSCKDRDALQTLAREAMAPFSDEECHLRPAECSLFAQNIKLLEILEQELRKPKRERKKENSLATLEALFGISSQRALELLRQRCLPVNRLSPTATPLAGRILGQAWSELSKRIMASHGLPWRLFNEDVRATLGKRKGYIHWRIRDSRIEGSVGHCVESIAENEAFSWLEPTLLRPNLTNQHQKLTYAPAHSFELIPTNLSLACTTDHNPFVEISQRPPFALRTSLLRDRLGNVAKTLQDAASTSWHSENKPTAALTLLASISAKLVQTLAHTQEIITSAEVKDTCGRAMTSWQTYDADVAQGLNQAGDCLLIWLAWLEAFACKATHAHKPEQLEETIDPLRMLTAWLLTNATNHFVHHLHKDNDSKTRQALAQQEEKLFKHLHVLQCLPPSHFFLIHAVFGIAGLTRQHSIRQPLAACWYEHATKLLGDNAALHAPRHPCGWPAGIQFGHQLYVDNSIMGQETNMALHRAFVIFDLLIETIRHGQPVRTLALSATLLRMCAQTLYTLAWLHRLPESLEDFAAQEFFSPPQAFIEACVVTHRSSFFELFFATMEVLSSLPHDRDQAAEYGEMALFMAAIAPASMTERAIPKILQSPQILEEIAQGFLLFSLSKQTPQPWLRSAHSALCPALKTLRWPQNLTGSFEKLLTGTQQDRTHVTRKIVAGMQRRGLADAESVFSPEYQEFVSVWLGDREQPSAELVANVKHRISQFYPYGSSQL